MNQKAHKVKPQLCFSKDIDSLRSLRQLSVKNYNILSKLKIVKQPFDDAKLSHQKSEFRKLSKTSSSIKNLKNLDLSSYKIQTLQISQLRPFLKKFYKIQQFSNPWAEKADKNLLLAFLPLLQNGKDLKSFHLTLLFNNLPRRFLSRMYNCKIRTLQLTQRNSSRDKRKPEVLVDFFKSFPSTIENLSLFGSRNMLQGLWKSAFPSSLKNLQKLELAIPLLGDDFQDIIKSISDPSKLKSLRFKIYQGDSSEIGEFLRRCISLEELDMRTGPSIRLDFYSGAVNMKLKKLMVEQVYKTNEDLVQLENLIEQQRESLDSFRLSLMLSEKNCFDKLFGNIKLLKNLKKFELKLTLSAFWQAVPIYEPLAEIVETLNSLEEIGFQADPPELKDPKESFERFSKALQKHSQSLKSLTLFLKYRKFRSYLKIIWLSIGPSNSMKILISVMKKSKKGFG